MTNSLPNTTESSNESLIKSQCALAEKHFKSGQLDQSFSVYQEILRQDPNYFDAVFGLGRVQHSRKIFVSVGRLYSKAMKLNPGPEDLEKVIVARKQLAKDVLNEALNLMEAGNLNQSINYFSQIIFALPPEYFEKADLEKAKATVDVTLPDKFVERGNKLFEEGCFSEAAYNFRKALLINSDHQEGQEKIDLAINKLIGESPGQNRPANKAEGKYPRVKLDDLRKINKVGFQKACEIASQLKGLIDNRKTLVEAKGLNAQTALPGGMWKNRFQGKPFDCQYDIVNHLRLHSSFTGNKLHALLDPSNFDIPESLKQNYLKMIKGLPDEMIARPPKMMGEIGWEIKGNVVNQDVLGYQERLSLLHSSGIIGKLKPREKLNILEIGSGYGGLAYFIKKIFPQASIYLCDLPESLVYPSIYLSLSMPECDHRILAGDEGESIESDAGFVCLPNYMFDRLQGMSFDLVINTLSFSGMSVEQVRDYSCGIKKMIGSEGFFFEQNQDNRPIGNINAQDIISEIFAGKTFSEKRNQGTANVWTNLVREWSQA